MKNTQWLADLGWGVFCHYLCEDRSMTAEDWNKQVDSFDIDGLVKQLQQVKAPYFFITVGQGSGHYCSPNETYDRITGMTPSKCSKRDIIKELYEALTPVGIKLLVYIPADGSWADKEVAKKLGMPKHWNDEEFLRNWQKGEVWAQFRWVEFMRNWEEICREWSERWGTNVHAWWVDGCYEKDYRYPENEEPNFKTFADALRAGNPNALVAFNPGILAPVIHYTNQEDYTAGEIATVLPECSGPFVTGPHDHQARLHILSYLGEAWGKVGLPRFPDEMVCGYTKHVTSKGGAISWDVPIETTGLINDQFIDQLWAIGNCMDNYKETMLPEAHIEAV